MPTSKDRPGDWNSDVIWLLERLAGLLANQGKGTGSVQVPRGAPGSPVVHYVRLTPTDLTSSSEVVIQMPETTRQWRLLSMQVHRVDGAASTWAPHVGQSSGFGIDGADDRLGLASQGFTTPFRKVFCQPVPMKADADFRLYFNPQLGGGTDNDIDLQLWFIQDFETEESS